ncbi:MAG: tRNA (N6-isopentenyl adenosine(37)-C2)-methylthiotransferase MiaB [Bacteroidetes bacterium]|nr:tRNA (N6-isopentenyl adenosine(37)-C2)-methylthiotransferase MiaB [Bacteroidota bacterium]MBK7970869.1 tRNA (N6-isopentenyl adenosine(37)-C2)-methylthiotransferase MiaB [Bacteroidota bacterium]MBK9424094.1 tRNA (N6-isopentenyl adenosine(37)-C2)-methylthiotransferase MiaB [Bacteroidota bacterium]
MIQENKVIDESRQGEAVMVESTMSQGTRKLYLESYGCAMNFSDSEIIASILTKHGYETTTDESEADVVFLNTCAIRENAELRVRQRLTEFKKRKQQKPDLIIGVLGCMAERLKSKLLEEEKLIDIVAGPDSYRDLPKLIESVDSGQKAVNVLLSREETYGDISPVRLGSNGVTAFVSITRGCDNMCSFCVVPFTRGRERSRDPESIVAEVRDLFERGYREITLLGQNVDSYIWAGGGLKKEILTEEQRNTSTSFAQLMERVALVSPELRVRFSTSNPRDMTDDALHVIARYDNICKYIHLPVQSGSTRVLQRMNRGYTREMYMERIEAIRRILPGCSLSTDTISGFCGETEEDHQETLSLMKWVGYQFSYMYKYSERPRTQAEREYKDDVDESVKSRRLAEIVALQQSLSKERTYAMKGQVHRVLIEGPSKKSADYLMGRTTGNIVMVFPAGNHKKGEYVDVYASDCTAATLIGEVVNKA